MFPFIVRVRGEVFVWGSEDLTVALSLPLVLVVNNDSMGDAVEIASHAPGGVRTVLGPLQPGQCWTLVLTGWHAVSATCQSDTTLACAIMTPS